MSPTLVSEDRSSKLGDGRLAIPSWVDSDQESVQHKGSFLRLPPEIRLKIYPLLLVIENGVPRAQVPCGHALDDDRSPSDQFSEQSHPVDSPGSLSIKQFAAPKIHPSILRTCRLINAEATPTLYTDNVFHAHSSLLTSLPRLPPYSRPISSSRALALIRRWHLDVRLDVDPTFDAERVERAFAGADSLVLRFGQAMWGASTGDETFKLFERVRVRRCKVEGTVPRWRRGRLEGILEGVQEATGDPEGIANGEGEHEGEERAWDLWLDGNR